MDPPLWFDADRREVWASVVLAAPRGLLTAADRGLLEVLVEHTLRWREACALVAKKGLLQRDKAHGEQERVHPVVKLAAHEAHLIAQVSAALGLTPLARSEIYLPPPTDGPRSELERLLDGPGLDGYTPRPS
jgi:P27 family predicted phage terminase small subunit